MIQLVFKKINSAPQEPDFKTPEGVKQLYHTYADEMLRLSVMKTGDTALAGDVVQEIFEDLWIRRETLKVRGPMENYLMRATKFRLIAHLRTTKSHKKHEDCAHFDQCQQDSYTEHQVVFNELQEKVNSLIDQLPCQCRNVYRLSQEEGLSNKEIASRLLISEATVSYHLKKAKNFLKEELTPYYNPTLLLIFMSLITSA
ncbi:MAG: RNA polymerase sigma-70 factor [Bacteroidota bacterium]